MTLLPKFILPHLFLAKRFTDIHPEGLIRAARNWRSVANLVNFRN